MAISFPPGMWPVSFNLGLINTSRSGGATLTGSEQVSVSGAGVWRFTGEFPFPASKQNALTNWEAFIASLSGRANTFLLPAFSYLRPLDGNGKKVSPVLAICPDGGMLFSDGTTLAQGENSYVTLAANAAIGATRITLPAATQSWRVPRPGMMFGLGERLYKATRVYRTLTTDAWTVDFVPPLRAAVSSGAVVITDKPVVEMRLATDESGQLRWLSRGASATLEAVEAF